MRTLKLALAAAAAFAFNANAAVTAVKTGTVGMGDGYATGAGAKIPAAGAYQAPIIPGSQPDSQGFHAGGVAACDGCHVMHNASGPGVAKSTLQGSAVAPWTNVTNMFLLQGTDQSSTCLICHEGAKPAGLQFTITDLTTPNVPANRTPGGDFGWLAQNFLAANQGAASPGERHGHNVVAADFGLAADTRLLIAPGGSYAVSPTGKAAFGCSSCHDPHGRYRMVNDAAKPNGVGFMGPNAANSLPIAASGSYGAAPTANYAVGAYRLLAGQGYAPVSNQAFPFPNDPPVAVAPMTYNSGEASAEVRVAYGTGMSEWCQNCHTSVHFNSGTRGVGIAGFRHPAGSDATLAANQISIYNTYISSGKVNPSATANYTSLVPFEQGKDKTIAALAGTTGSSSIIAADASSNVMCLSCHRAHATAFDSMVRWDQQATFISNGTQLLPGVTTRTTAQTTAGYYDRAVGVGGTSIGAYQRSLCNKCHGKD
jgi:predicted CXXCH cytochrome family protein